MISEIMSSLVPDQISNVTCPSEFIVFVPPFTIVLKTLDRTAFEMDVGKGENAGNQNFVPFL